MNVAADPVSNGNIADWRLNYRLNGGTVHSVPFVPTNGAGSFIFSIPVDTGELVTGTNTVQFSGPGFLGGYKPFIGNIDLVIQ